MGLTEHLNGQFCILHRHGSQPHIVFGMVARDLGQVVVQEPRQISGIIGFRPIREHHWDGADHLHLHPRFAIFLNALLGVPTIGGDFSEEEVVSHHVGESRTRHLQMDESPVAEFL